MSRWFKFYDDVLYDPKVQRLPKDVAWNWVNILCLASKGGGKLPPISDIAFALRITDREADALIETLLSAGLLDDIGGSMCPHNWHERQGTGDTNAERQRRFRERRKSTVTDNVTRNVTVTDASNGVTPLEKIREEKIREERGERARALISPKLIFPEDGSIHYGLWGEMVRRLVPGADVDAVASAFRNWCREKKIPLDAKGIEKTLEGFCRKLKKRFAA